MTAGSEATVEVQVDATNVGNFSGELSLTTNDIEENPFNFAIADVNPSFLRVGDRLLATLTGVEVSSISAENFTLI